HTKFFFFLNLVWGVGGGVLGGGGIGVGGVGVCGVGGKWGSGEAVSSPYHPKTLSPQNPITLSPDDQRPTTDVKLETSDQKN
ncbi:MAG: hypothetical protein O9275_02610, partial [Microcystis sp. LE19-196.1B]|nr:hypothetical protein [Microcystis sp. LE19-196.1B]